jgi:hypothetical protein
LLKVAAGREDFGIETRANESKGRVSALSVQLFALALAVFPPALAFEIQESAKPPRAIFASGLYSCGKIHAAL